jgi:hypothetical protein
MPTREEIGDFDPSNEPDPVYDEDNARFLKESTEGKTKYTIHKEGRGSVIKEKDKQNMEA